LVFYWNKGWQTWRHISVNAARVYLFEIEMTRPSHVMTKMKPQAFVAKMAMSLSHANMTTKPYVLANTMGVSITYTKVK
jgi:hypothetical protein